MKNLCSCPQSQLRQKQFSLELERKPAPGGHDHECEHPVEEENVKELLEMVTNCNMPFHK